MLQLLTVVTKRLNLNNITRVFSTMASKIVDIEEVEKLKDDTDVLIVDVREPEEVQSTGLIGKSVNIPLASVKDALQDSTEESFQNTYGRPKPDLDYPLIFYCLKGGRASKAAELAESLGFKNARFYKGSWEEWSSKHS